MSGAGPLVRATDLAVDYDDGRAVVRALSAVTFDLAAEERLCVIGESGSGKSTLALALGGLLPANARLAGRLDWAGGPPRAGRDIGFVFQDPSGSLDPVMTVGDQIAEVIVTHAGVGWGEARRRAVELIARVALADPPRVARAYPHQLSGGMRQRAALAAALAGAPRLLVADEATSALDTVVQAEIVALLDELVRDCAMALVFVTHDIALAARVGGRLAVFYAGRLVELGPAATVLAAPRHPYTAALIDAHIDLDGPVRHPHPTIPGGPPESARPPPGCRFAPRCPRAAADCAGEPGWSGDRVGGFACRHPLGEDRP